jgi:tellurite resistance protein TehA-like permease
MADLIKRVENLEMFVAFVGVVLLVTSATVGVDYLVARIKKEKARKSKKALKGAE